ncbi:MAG: hypothetical protein H6Q74_614 [Firmicutes bacterium]|nr:hypothetical protein [Bacillota bacterium]
MINVKKWCLAILMITMFIIGTTAVWLVYYGNFAPKLPLRAKQVGCYQIDYGLEQLEERL